MLYRHPLTANPPQGNHPALMIMVFDVHELARAAHIAETRHAEDGAALHPKRPLQRRRTSTNRQCASTIGAHARIAARSSLLISFPPARIITRGCTGLHRAITGRTFARKAGGV